MKNRIAFVGALTCLLLYVLYVLVTAVVVINPKTVPQTSYLVNIDVRERMARPRGVNTYYTYYMFNVDYAFGRRLWKTGLPSFTKSEYQQFKDKTLPVAVSYYVVVYNEKPTHGPRLTSEPFGLRPGDEPHKGAWYWLSVIKHITDNLYVMLFLLACLFAAIAAYGFNENTPAPSRKPLVLLIINFILFFAVFIYFFT